MDQAHRAVDADFAIQPQIILSGLPKSAGDDHGAIAIIAGALDTSVGGHRRAVCDAEIPVGEIGGCGDAHHRHDLRAKRFGHKQHEPSTHGRPDQD